MANVKNNAAAQETRRRLIEAAGAIFAERGLHAATIKEITDRAGVNVAAINYHFRDKFELYAAVIRYALSIASPPAAEEYPGSPEDRLRAHIAFIINDLNAPHLPRWRATLMAHEFAQPTAALDAVMEELIRPRAEILNSIVRAILGLRATEEQVVRASLSIGAQCFLYIYQREIVRRLHPDVLHDDNRNQVVRHIADFSLAALHAMRQKIDPRHRPTPRRQRHARRSVAR